MADALRSRDKGPENLAPCFVPQHCIKQVQYCTSIWCEIKFPSVSPSPQWEAVSKEVMQRECNPTSTAIPQPYSLGLHWDLATNPIGQSFQTGFLVRQFWLLCGESSCVALWALGCYFLSTSVSVSPPPSIGRNLSLPARIKPWVFLPDGILQRCTSLNLFPPPPPKLETSREETDSYFHPFLPNIIVQSWLRGEGCHMLL